MAGGWGGGLAEGQFGEAFWASHSPLLALERVTQPPLEPTCPRQQLSLLRSQLQGLDSSHVSKQLSVEALSWEGQAAFVQPTDVIWIRVEKPGLRLG